MGDNIYEHSDLTNESIRQIFDDAGFDAEIDDDGDVKLKNTEGHTCFVRLSAKGPERLSWLSLWKGNPEKNAAQRLLYVNKVNTELIGPRAMVNSHDGITFQHVMFLQGGVTRKNIIHTTHRFFSMTGTAVGMDEDDVIG